MRNGRERPSGGDSATRAGVEGGRTAGGFERPKMLFPYTSSSSSPTRSQTHVQSKECSDIFEIPMGHLKAPSSAFSQFQCKESSPLRSRLHVPYFYWDMAVN